jgi:hypothetical protein
MTLTRLAGGSHESALASVDHLIAIWITEAPMLSRRPSRPSPRDPSADRSGLLVGIVQDVRYGLRLLSREPGATATAVLTIALAIAATTTLFSVAYGTLLKPLPPAPFQRGAPRESVRCGHFDPEHPELKAGQS